MPNQETFSKGALEAQAISSGAGRRLPPSWEQPIWEIQAALAEVNPLTIEEWTESFRRAVQPQAELGFWLRVARSYSDATRNGARPLKLRDRNGVWIP